MRNPSAERVYGLYTAQQHANTRVANESQYSAQHVSKRCFSIAGIASLPLRACGETSAPQYFNSTHHWLATFDSVKADLNRCKDTCSCQGVNAPPEGRTRDNKPALLCST